MYILNIIIFLKLKSLKKRTSFKGIDIIDDIILINEKLISKLEVMILLSSYVYKEYFHFIIFLRDETFHLF